jgi:O-antigen/teichoic acid export membrane protein
MSVTRSRLLLSSGANFLGIIAKILQQLIIVPILLLAWSPELYGEWLLVSAIPVYISLSDFGFIAASSNELARRALIESDENVQIFYDRATVYFQRWSIVFALSFAAFSYLVPLPKFLGLTIMTQHQAGLVFLLLTLNAIVMQNGLSVLAGLRVKGKYHVGVMIMGLALILQLIVAFGLIKIFQAGPVGIAASMLCTSAASYIVQFDMLRRYGLKQTTPPLTFRYDPNAEPMKRYLLLGAEMMLMPLAQAVALQGSTILVGKVLGATAVTIFSTHRTLARLSVSLLLVLSNPLTAEAGLLQREEDRPMLTRVVTVLSRLTFWLSIIISGALLFLGPWIFSIWTHKSIAFQWPLFLPLLACVTAEAMWRVPAAIRLGTNQHRPIAWGYLIFSVTGVIAAALLASAFGLPGAAIGVSLTDIGMAILAVWTMKGVIDITLSTYAKGLFNPPVKEMIELGQRLIAKARGKK